MPKPPKSILVIRRDNIGDLLLSTPLISALRHHYPAARLCALVNSYNAPVLADNPNLDEVYRYTKSKHHDGSKLLNIWKEFSIYRTLRRQQFDLVIHANPSPSKRVERLVHFIHPKASLGVVDTDTDKTRYSLPITPDQVRGKHHAERVFSLLQPLGITGQPGPMTLISQHRSENVIGIHLSSRKPCNRWPLDHYASLIQTLVQTGKAIHLFWAPGTKDNPQHPGDDELADALMKRIGCLAKPVATHSLSQLIDEMALCETVISPDGGALHIATALGKPVVALFGCTDAGEWGPWSKNHQLLVGEGQECKHILPAQVAKAWQKLVKEALI